jgi:hypothetical protein
MEFYLCKKMRFVVYIMTIDDMYCQHTLQYHK